MTSRRGSLPGHQREGGRSSRIVRPVVHRAVWVPQASRTAMRVPTGTRDRTRTSVTWRTCPHSWFNLGTRLAPQCRYRLSAARALAPYPHRHGASEEDWDHRPNAVVSHRRSPQQHRQPWDRLEAPRSAEVSRLSRAPHLPMNSHLYSSCICVSTSMFVLLVRTLL